MNADLHTDLANKEEREKITLAGRKVKTVVEALTEDKGTTKQNVIKAGLRAINIDELRKDKQKEFNLVDDKETTPLDKLIVLRDLQAELYKREGFTGELPELLLTDEPNSFAHNGKIFISINDLNSGNASALLYAHENAHLVDYDKGEEIAKYAETKIGKNDPNEKFTESEREEYINSLRERVKIDKTLEEQFEIARNTPINERENWAVSISESINVSMGYHMNIGGSMMYIFDEVTGKKYIAKTIDGGIGIGTPSIGYNPSFSYFPNINSVEEIEGIGINIGGTVLNFSGDIQIDPNNFDLGFSISADKVFPKLSNSLDMGNLLDKKIFDNEIHGALNYSKIIWSREIKDKTLEDKMNKAMTTKENFILFLNEIKRNSKQNQETAKESVMKALEKTAEIYEVYGSE